MANEEKEVNVTFTELANFFPAQIKATEVADNHQFTLYGGSRGPGKVIGSDGISCENF